MKKIEQVKALSRGKGIQYLLDAAYTIFQYPIAMFGINNYDLMAYTNVSSDDPLWNELISTGTFSMETQQFFADECFTEDVANADKLVLLKSKKLKHDRIHGNIYNRDYIKVANLVMIGTDAPFEAEETAAFEELVDLFTSEIRDDQYYIEYGKACQETIIIMLLDGIIKEPRIYTPHMQIFYDGFMDYLYVAVIDISQCDISIEIKEPKETEKERLIYFKKLLQNKYRSCKYAVYSGYIVMVMSSKHKDFYEGILFDSANNPFTQNNLYVGISSSFENPYELRKYYDMAVAALKHGIKKNNDKWYFV